MPELTVTHTPAGYRATREGETLTIHRVPIFVDCEREYQDRTVVFDAKWVAGAVATAMQQQRDNYLPPLHIWHHDDDGKRTAKRAGTFRITDAAPISLKGTRRIAIMADLIITDKSAQKDILKSELPYRSVEIYDVEEAKINSLALLDTEPPFLELPMLAISKVEGDTAAPRSSVIDTVIPGAKSGLVRVASLCRGPTAHLLFKEEPEMDAKTPEQVAADAVEDRKQAELFKDDDKKKDGDKKEEMQSAPLDVSSVVKAIESGEISVADMDAILAAIQAQGGPAETPEDKEPAPAAVPGQSVMKKEMTPDVVQMRAELDGLKLKDAQRDSDQKRKDDVGTAMERLRDRPLGDHDALRKTLSDFHKEAKGNEALFTAYVDALDKNNPPLPGDDPFLGTGGNLPEVAMKYQKDGPAVVEKVAKISRSWQDAKRHGVTSLSEERYIEVQMMREAGRN